MPTAFDGPKDSNCVFLFFYNLLGGSYKFCARINSRMFPAKPILAMVKYISIRTMYTVLNTFFFIDFRNCLKEYFFKRFCSLCLKIGITSPIDSLGTIPELKKIHWLTLIQECIFSIFLSQISLMRVQVSPSRPQDDMRFNFLLMTHTTLNWSVWVRKNKSCSLSSKYEVK